jgi:2-polyprenyl-6-methoxyphenol hydroxylase-like FAD-dependent oxidoreductase
VPRALIVGAGIGGLASAIALQRAGLDVAIVEQAAAIREIGAGISLWANAIGALDRLGLGTAVRAASLTYDNAGVRTSDGTVLSTFDTAEMRRRLGHPIVVMHRADLLGALATAAGQPIEFSKRCVRVRQESTAAVADLDDGSSVRADVLIGADGLYSVVRAAIHGDERPRYSGCAAWRSVVRFDGTVLPGESWGHGSVFGQVPMEGGRVYWFATENVPAGEPRSADEKARLLARFGSWHAPIRQLIEAAREDEILRNDIYDRPPLPAWGRGRITLVGDAAHPMVPFLGQGGCQALEDAVALGVAVQSASGLPAALQQYERSRLARANMFVRRSRLAGRIARVEHPIGIAIRNALVRRANPRRQARHLARMIR